MFVKYPYRKNQERERERERARKKESKRKRKTSDDMRDRMKGIERKAEEERKKLPFQQQFPSLIWLRRRNFPMNLNVPTHNGVLWFVASGFKLPTYPEKI